MNRKPTRLSSCTAFSDLRATGKPHQSYSFTELRFNHLQSHRRSNNCIIFVRIASWIFFFSAPPGTACAKPSRRRQTRPEKSSASTRGTMETRRTLMNIRTRWWRKMSRNSSRNGKSRRLQSWVTRWADGRWCTLHLNILSSSSGWSSLTFLQFRPSAPTEPTSRCSSTRCARLKFPTSSRSIKVGKLLTSAYRRSSTSNLYEISLSRTSRNPKTATFDGE